MSRHTRSTPRPKFPPGTGRLEAGGKIQDVHAATLGPRSLDMRFKIQRSQDSRYYFEIQAAGNYETLATSETHVDKADAQHAVDLIMQCAAGAPVVDAT